MKKTHHPLPPTLALLAALVAGALALSPVVALADGQVTNGILVTVRTTSAGGGASPLSTAESALESAGVEVTGVVSEEDGSVTLQAQPADGQTDEEALAAAQALPDVEEAQLNYVYSLIEPVEETSATADGTATGGAATAPEGLATPLSSVDGTLVSLASISVNDPFAQVSSPSTSPNQYWLYTSGLVGAWDQLPALTGSADAQGGATAQDGTAARDGSDSSTEQDTTTPVIVIAMDTGATLDHEDLAANLVTDLAYDAANERPLSQDASTDTVGHGTAVAGIISAVANNGVGLAGATRNTAQVLPVKITYDDGHELANQADTASFVRAYRYVLALIDAGELQNVRVVNVSLGAYGESFDADGALHAVIQEALGEYGILTVCAGGNGDNVEPYTDAIYPGDYEECVCVTALEADGTNVHWSDYNQYKDIGAPGRSIWTTYTSYSYVAGGYYGSLSGTSLSAPIVSGAVALLYAADPDATPQDVLEALYATAQPIDDPDDDRTQTSGSHGALAADDAAEHLSWHVANPVSFTDVSCESWYYDPVTYVAAEGIMTGYADGSGSFGAAAYIERQDAALLLYRYLANGETAPSHGFSDVEAGAYYEAAVDWCAANGVFTGYQDGSNDFGVGDPLTREDLMVVLYRIAGSPALDADGSALDAFPDSDLTSPYAADAVTWAVSRGIVSGAYRDGVLVLAPLDSISRAEVATIMQRAIESGEL